MSTEKLIQLLEEKHKQELDELDRKHNADRRLFFIACKVLKNNGAEFLELLREEEKQYYKKSKMTLSDLEAVNAIKELVISIENDGFLECLS